VVQQLRHDQIAGRKSQHKEMPLGVFLARESFIEYGHEFRRKRFRQQQATQGSVIVKAQKAEPLGPYHLTIEQGLIGGIADPNPAALCEDTPRDYFEPDRPNGYYCEQKQHEYRKRNGSI